MKQSLWCRTESLVRLNSIRGARLSAYALTEELPLQSHSRQTLTSFSRLAHLLADGEASR